MNVSASSSLVIGSVLLDKYRVERILGQGGMGYVVAVRHLQLGQLRAMKFLYPDALDHPEAVERFLREAQAAAVLHSHHVVRVHDVGRMPEGDPYIVMEYLEGCDLKKYLDRQGPLPIEEAVRFVLHACDAIAEAHRQGIIHRDLKPANLFLTKQRDGDPIVKVVDFGISKHTAPDKPELTGTNATLGSPLYMSPEQIDKSKTVDARTDVWALGVIAYELLTGRSPFYASTAYAIALKVAQDEPIPLRDVRSDVPEELAAIITRCLEKKRKERWNSVDELATELSNFAPQTSLKRPSLPLIANKVIVDSEAVIHPPTIAEPALTMPNEVAVMPPTADPPDLTFGTTSRENMARAAGASRRTTIVTWAVIATGMAALVGVLFLACTSTEPNRVTSQPEIAPPVPDTSTSVPAPVPSWSAKPPPVPRPTVSTTSSAPSPRPSATAPPRKPTPPKKYKVGNN